MAAFFAGSITSNLKFTAKVPLLMKATSNDEKPTQGYDLQEINRISKSSLPNCQSLLTFLLGRLEKKDPRIKFKVLHLMKYLVINGHSEFRAQLRHNAEAVKKTVSFQGELDPVHGDGLNLKVQQAASELEKLLFDVDNPEVENIYKSMLGPDESGKKMQGFGYTAATEIKKEASFMDTLMKVKKSSSEIFNKNKAAPNVPFNEYEQISAKPEAQYTPVDLEDSEDHLSSYFSSVDGYDKDEICDENDMISDDFYERKLVENITAEAGLTKVPSKETLKDFMNKSSSLDIPVILKILDERLQSLSLNVQMKSLCVVECMLRSNLLKIPREINEYCPSIHLLVQSQDQTVQAKANKIVLAIASCLTQDENQLASRVVVPPNYNDAKEIPTMKDETRNETDHKVTTKTDFNTLFSGMNLSSGAKLVSNRKLVEHNEPLIDIENPSALLENSEVSTMSNTNESDSKQNPTENDRKIKEESSNLFLVQKHSGVHVDQFASSESSKTQSSNSVCLMSLETPEKSILDFSTPLQNRDSFLLESNELKSNLNAREVGQETEKQTLGQEGRLLFNSKESMGQASAADSSFLVANNVDLLNWEQSKSASNSSLVNFTQNPENLLLINTEPQKAIHINPNRTVQCNPQYPNSGALSFQPQPRSRAFPEGLVLATNSSSPSPRRPFPKDMKSETGGFDFIRKSTKSDAFSFINDEIQASKTKK